MKIMQLFKRKKDEKNEETNEKVDKKKGKKDPEEEAEKEDEGKGNKFQIIKKIGLFLLIFIILCIGIYFSFGLFNKGYKTYQSKKEDEAKKIPYISKIKLKEIDMDEKTLQFTYDNLPTVYLKLLNYNQSIALLNEEIKRIESLKSQYPSHSSLISSELNKVQRLKKTFYNTYLIVKREIEKIYVSKLINEQKGIEFLERNRDSLESRLDDLITNNQEYLTQLKMQYQPKEKEPGLFDKIKNFF